MTLPRHSALPPAPASPVAVSRPVDLVAAERAVRALLWAIGEDPDRAGLAETAPRVARLWAEFFAVRFDGRATTFAVEHVDQMVLVKGMRVWSMCEHHLLPFWCDVSAAYITRGKLLGLSKFARIAHQAAARLSVQESLVERIATTLRTVTGSPDVAVFADGEHLCLTMRGAKTPARMISTAMHGAFRDEPATRAEFLSLLRS